MKRAYQSPCMQTAVFDVQDVLTASAAPQQNQSGLLPNAVSGSPVFEAGLDNLAQLINGPYGG